MDAKEISQLIDQSNSLFNAGKFYDVIALLPNATLENYNSALLYVCRSRAYISIKNYNAVISDLNKAIEINPATIWAYLLRGNALLNTAQYDAAITDYNKVIELDEKNADAYNNLGLSNMYKKEYDAAIENFTKSIAINATYPYTFYNLGNAWLEKKEYDNAISNYTKAIDLDSNYALAYYNMGNAKLGKKDYDGAIADYTKMVALDPKYADAFYNRGLSWYNKKDYDKAIEDYNKTILLNEDYVNAYYNRGLAWYDKYEYNNAIDDLNKAINLNSKQANAYYLRALSYNQIQNYREAINDFKTYLQLLNNANDYYSQVAQSTIKELDKKIANDWYSEITDIIFRIKKLLLFELECVTHYTGLSAGKAMVLSKSKLRLSEGAFLNDTSEGRELFEYLEFTTVNQKSDKTLAEPFAEKPFIGSFVTEAKHDDLTLWRMYGKEDKVEAKGCALTIQKDFFLTALKTSLNGKTKTADSIRTDEQFTFFKVAYVAKKDESEFIVPDDEIKSQQLTVLMKELKLKIDSLENDKKVEVKELLNTIAYLFKSAEYQFENEVRLIVQGVGFDKTIDISLIPPKVFIELVEITPVLTKITFGPKVERADEWAAAFNYQIKKDNPDSNIQIVISHLPFK